MKIKKVRRSTDILIPLSLSLVGYIRVYFHLPYRQTEGIIKASGKNMPNHPNSYGQICRRLSTLDIDNSSSKIEDDDDGGGDIVIAIDSTGIKVTNRGQWLRDKWNIRKKGYLSQDPCCC